jgi:hypothetical protein
MYPEETWEWTIGRDFKDRLTGNNDLSTVHLEFLNEMLTCCDTDTSAFYLEAALKVAATDYKPILNAVYVLESTIYFERSIEGGKPSSALLKNTGLAHVNLIQNKLIPQSNKLPKPMGDIFNTTSQIEWPLNEE